MRPAPRRPGNSCTWSVRRAPAESTSQKIGTCSASAASEARTIFSTVRAPHDPALTIGSLATTTTGIPSIVPRPVTTPSAGNRPPSSAAWLLASRPSSTNDCGSSNRSTRSRAVSLFCPRILASGRSSGSRALSIALSICSPTTQTVRAAAPILVFLRLGFGRPYDRSMLTDLVLVPFDAAVPDLVAAAQAADQGGFDTVWTYDHFSGLVVGAGWS